MSHCCPLECVPTCGVMPPNCAMVAELLLGSIAPSTQVTINFEAVDIGREYAITLTSDAIGDLKVDMALHPEVFIAGRVFYVSGVPIVLPNESSSVNCIKLKMSKQLNQSICPSLQTLQAL